MGEDNDDSVGRFFDEQCVDFREPGVARKLVYTVRRNEGHMFVKSQSDWDEDVYSAIIDGQERVAILFETGHQLNEFQALDWMRPHLPDVRSWTTECSHGDAQLEGARVLLCTLKIASGLDIQTPFDATFVYAALTPRGLHEAAVARIRHTGTACIAEPTRTPNSEP